MTTRNHTSLLAAALAAGLSFAAAPPADALTAQECSAKYQAAKTAGTLNGQAWNDFRKTQCGADAAAAPAATDASAPKTAEAKPDETKPEAKRAKAAAKSGASPAAPASAGPATFPTAVDAKFAKEPAARARLHTCAESWKANKAANTTGGLRWIQKGGGYWSECNKKLKG